MIFITIIAFLIALGRGQRKSSVSRKSCIFLLPVILAHVFLKGLSTTSTSTTLRTIYHIGIVLAINHIASENGTGASEVGK